MMRITLADLGDFADDPRILNRVSTGVSVVGGHLIRFGHGVVAYKDNEPDTCHPSVVEALKHLLGEPMSLLAWALQQAMAPELRAYLLDEAQRATLAVCGTGHRDAVAAWSTLGNALRRSVKVA